MFFEIFLAEWHQKPRFHRLLPIVVILRNTPILGRF